MRFQLFQSDTFGDIFGITAQDMRWNPKGPGCEDHPETESFCDIHTKEQVSVLKGTDVIGTPNTLKDVKSCYF